MSQKRTHKTLSIAQKQNIILAIDNGTKKIDVAKQFDVAPSTITSILQKKEFIMQASSSSKLKRQKHAEYPNQCCRQKSLILWITQCRQSNVPIGGELLKEKALFFAKAMNIMDFKASSGWLDRFKHRHNIAFKKMCGESSSVDDDVCSEWKEKLSDLIKDYEDKDIFNADETGLFYKCLPDRTYCFKNEKCHGDSQINIDYRWATICDSSEKSGSFEDYINVDNDVAVSGMLTDDDILEEVFPTILKVMRMVTPMEKKF
nr:tigger transposable element-derived protein 6-like [Drosophila bipectinata]